MRYAGASSPTSRPRSCGRFRARPRQEESHDGRLRAHPPGPGLVRSGQGVLLQLPLRAAAGRPLDLGLHLRQPAGDAAAGPGRGAARASYPPRQGLVRLQDVGSRAASVPRRAARGASSASPFEPDDIALTTGAFAAIMVAFRLVLDAGDEAIVSGPAWFCYEPMLLAADAVPRAVDLRAPELRPRPRRHRRRDRPADADGDRQHPAQPQRPDLPARGAGGPGRPARARLGAHRPAHLPPLRRAVPPAALRRPRLRQPRRGLPLDPRSPTATARCCSPPASGWATWRCRR